MKKSQKQAIAIGAGVAALAAAATGVYFMTGKNAKNRKKVAKWMGDMQKDVVQELNKAGKASQAVYNKTVDTVAKNYAGLKKCQCGGTRDRCCRIKVELGSHQRTDGQRCKLCAPSGPNISEVSSSQSKRWQSCAEKSYCKKSDY